jgi:polysaccharide biosynthesis protein VpsQ
MRLWALGYFVFIASIVILADAGLLMGAVTLIHSIPWGDKVGHLVLASGLGFFANVWLREPFVQLAGVRVQRANLALFPAVLVEEVSQRWIPGRTFDLRDLAADLIGLVIGSALAIAWCRRRAQRLPT